MLLIQPNNAAFHTRAAELMCRAFAECGGASGWGEREVRSARMHAAEAALADAAYLHVCAAGGQAPAAGTRLLTGQPLERVAARAARGAAGAGAGAAAAAGALKEVAANFASSDAVAGDREEDASLHSLAALSLLGLAAGGAGSEAAAAAAAALLAPAAAAATASTVGDAFPALAVEASLLSATAVATLLRQSSLVLA